MNHSPVLFYVKVHSITHKLLVYWKEKTRVSWQNRSNMGMQDLETGKNIVFKGKIAWWYWLIVIGTNALLLYELFFSGDSIVLLLGVLIFCNVIYLPMLKIGRAHV